MKKIGICEVCQEKPIAHRCISCKEYTCDICQCCDNMYTEHYTPNTYTNKHGGKQSKLDVRFDLLDPYAMSKLAGVVCVGAEKYEINNWHKIPVNEHLNHAQYHINAYYAGDTSEDHLAHAFCRLMFANSDKLVKDDS